MITKYLNLPNRTDCNKGLQNIIWRPDGFYKLMGNYYKSFFKKLLSVFVIKAGRLNEALKHIKGEIVFFVTLILGIISIKRRQIK